MENQLATLKQEYMMHHHTGTDSLNVYMGDLRYDNRGMNFPSMEGNINLKVYTDPSGLNPTEFLITPPPNNNANFTIGNTNPFKKITLQAEEINNLVVASAVVPNTRILDSVDDTVESSSREMYADYIEIQSTAKDTTGWFLRLPNNTVLPASPVLGDICIYNGRLQVCQVAGAWVQK